jgi:hypothetical protein
MIGSANQLIVLRTSEDPVIHQKAAHDSATQETWRKVIERYPKTRTWIARNKTVPSSSLEILSHDENADARYTVAMKRKAGQDILQRLAQDSDESVRLRVTLNPKTPKTILEQLLNNKWSRVVEEAKNRLEEDFIN